jgi:hypothetical protein
MKNTATFRKGIIRTITKRLMQQLFSGKLRFKDENGNDYAVGRRKLGDVVEKKTELDTVLCSQVSMTLTVGL